MEKRCRQRQARCGGTCALGGRGGFSRFAPKQREMMRAGAGAAGTQAGLQDVTCPPSPLNPPPSLPLPNPAPPFPPLVSLCFSHRPSLPHPLTPSSLSPPS